VVAFSQGNRVGDFAGLQPEARLRDFISHLLPPSPASLMVQKGNSLLATNDLRESREAFDEAIRIAPEYPGALLGLMKIDLLEGKPETAFKTYRTFPASQEYNQAERLLPLIKAMQDAVAGRLPQESDLELAFYSSMRMAARGNLLASVDGMMDILRQDKHFKRDRGKQVVLGLLELLDQEAEQTRLYRKELTSILF
jgi:putative thioredoxin